MFRLALLSNAGLALCMTPSEYMQANCGDIINWGKSPPRCNVKTRKDLPEFDNSCMHEIVFVSHPTSGFTNNKKSGGAVGFYHTGYAFKENCKNRSNYVYTFEFWAKEFTVPGIIVPEVRSERPVWRNEAVTTWSACNPHDAWGDHTTLTEVSVGHADGSTLNAFMNWILEWRQKHQNYLLYNVWSDSTISKARRFLNDVTCSRFTEDSLTALATTFGVQMGSKEVLCRTYVILQAKSLSVKGDDKEMISDEAVPFFQAVQAVLDTVTDLTLDKALSAIQKAIAAFRPQTPYAYVYNRDSDTYYEAEMRPPFVAYGRQYVYQRMTLPWQSAADARDGECPPPPEASEISSGHSSSNQTIVV